MTPSEADKDLDRRIEALTPTAYFAFQLTMQLFVNRILDALFELKERDAQIENLFNETSK